MQSQDSNTMQKGRADRSEFKLIGISVRTSNQLEFDKSTAKIPSCVQRYFHQSLFERIPNRSNPGTTICAYTDYESDHKGAYTYFIGEEVSSVPSELPDGLELLTVPAQIYTKFTTQPGPMPNVIINAWQQIWKMNPQDLGGERAYETDFELYDERAQDHYHVVADLYIGLNHEH